MPSKSLFPQFCKRSVVKYHWPSKLNSLGGSQSLWRIPRLGNLLWALEHLQQYENFFGIIALQSVGRLLSGSTVGLMVTSSKRAYATCCMKQVCFSQSPCSCSRPLLTHASTGDTQTLIGRSGSVCVGSGSWCTQGFVCALRTSLVGMGFGSKCDFIPPTILLGLLLCRWMWGIFFWCNPTVSCQRLFSSKLQFWSSRRRKRAHVLLLHHLSFPQRSS